MSGRGPGGLVKDSIKLVCVCVFPHAPFRLQDSRKPQHLCVGSVKESKGRDTKLDAYGCICGLFDVVILASSFWQNVKFPCRHGLVLHQSQKHLISVFRGRICHSSSFCL